MSVTSIFGILGFYFLVTTYEVHLNYYKLARVLVIGIAVLLLVGFGVKKSRMSIKGFSLEKVKRFVIRFPRKKIVLGFLFSILRYLIFSFQFYFLLQLLGVNMTYLNAMVVITSMYLLASIIPSIFIFDVVIKGSVALYLFALMEVNELTILSIITIMWLLNFVLPSIFGSFYVLHFNLPKNEA